MGKGKGIQNKRQKTLYAFCSYQSDLLSSVDLQGFPYPKVRLFGLSFALGEAFSKCVDGQIVAKCLTLSSKLFSTSILGYKRMEIVKQC